MVPRLCEMCTSPSPALAVVYCDADSCFLCAACDVQVHEANRLAQRHVRRPVSAADAEPASEESDILVPDVDASNLSDSLARDPVCMGDADVAYSDFEDFEGVAFGKMPSLNASDSDAAFLSIVPAGGLKAFDSDLSWEAVVPDEFELVVPDVMVGNPATSSAKTSVVSASKTESMISKSLSASGASVPACPVVPTTTGRPPHMCKSTHLSGLAKLESPVVSHVTMPGPLAPCSALSQSLANGVAEVAATSVGTDSSKPQSLDEMGCGSADGELVLSLGNGIGQDDGEEDEKKTAEQRKQLRAEALIRFRAKRANRSFRKKIRYGCRKVLAESRPRVKGRFVKKCDMALYALHGADYVKYKSTGAPESGSNAVVEQVIPSLS